MDSAIAFVLLCVFTCVLSCVSCSSTTYNVTVESVIYIKNITIPLGYKELHLQFNGGNRQVLNEHVFPSSFVQLEALTINIRTIETIEENSFQQMSNLKSLTFYHEEVCDASNNGIRNITPSTFNGLSNLLRLNLQKLCLTHLQRGSFVGLSSLKSLDLSSNMISEIEDFTFDPLIYLEELNLQQNALSEITEWWSDDKNHLTKLDVSFNDVDMINNSTFQRLPALDRLDLSNNKINSSALEYTFTHLIMLKTLKLNNNQLEKLNVKMFGTNLNNLLILSVSHNQLTAIEHDTLKPMQKLEALFLHYNRLTNLEEGMVSGIEYLHTLDLNDNQIESVGDNAFSGLVNLNVLDLHNNQISSISDTAFEDTSGLIVLVLFSNQLTTLPTTLINQLPNVKQLMLGNNPWVCNCTMITFLDEYYFNKVAQIITDAEIALCASPEHLRNHTFYEMTYKLTDCKPSTHSLDTTIITSGTTMTSLDTTPEVLHEGTILPEEQMSTDDEIDKSKLYIIIICVILLGVLIVAVIIVCFIYQYKTDKWYPNKTEDTERGDNDQNYLIRRDPRQQYIMDPVTEEVNVVPKISKDKMKRNKEFSNAAYQNSPVKNENHDNNNKDAADINQNIRKDKPKRTARSTLASTSSQRPMISPDIDTHFDFSNVVYAQDEPPATNELTLPVRDLENISEKSFQIEVHHNEDTNTIRSTLSHGSRQSLSSIEDNTQSHSGSTHDSGVSHSGISTDENVNETDSTNHIIANDTLTNRVFPDTTTHDTTLCNTEERRDSGCSDTFNRSTRLQQSVV